MFETLAPYIIAGLLIATGYLLTRWSAAVNYGKEWKATAEEGWRQATRFGEQVEGMRKEGCAAMGALENIFNGVTAGGMPHSKLVKKVADVATEALIDTTGCDHKEALVLAESEVEFLAGELMVCRQNLLNWEAVATNASGRADEAERLLGLVNDRLIVERSKGRIL